MPNSNSITLCQPKLEFAHQGSVCIDRINQYLRPVEKLMATHQSLADFDEKNPPFPRSSFSDGPYNENNQDSNNASNLIEIMTSISLILDFHSCISIISGLHDMSASGCPPDAITYNTIIRSMFSRGKFNQAIAFWLNQLRNGCPPQIIISIILVELLWKHRGMEQAMEVSDEMEVKGCSSPCEAGKFEDVKMALYDLLLRGLEPKDEDLFSIMDCTSNNRIMITYNILINSLCKSGLLDRAIDFLAQIVSQGCSLDIITNNTFCGCYVQDVSPVQVTYNIVIDGLAKKGLIWWKVVNMLMEMVRKRFRPQIGTYNTMIEGLCIGNKVDVSIDILDVMVSTRCRPNEATYGTLIRGVASAGKTRGH
ncbi:hypothetical protein AMTRI_Chr07g75820 [Amborella trichopoda]